MKMESVFPEDGLVIAIDKDTEKVIDGIVDAVKFVFSVHYHDMPDGLLLYTMLVQQGWTPPKGKAIIVQEITDAPTVPK